ncbi:PREDICTED: uncharacterized protein LOC104607022 [Nelumbo nucifera]|uniref:Uncharacterized protein LOC104607022 n=1 Tax=Nelumbo nucifera TaxID=4432 RepID=A0A1U8AW36_NELNU|nr:PREDICTED: uncharacterized protein LOC104607022 [Nelumbo nucifera]
MAIKDSSYVKWPPRLRGDPTTRNRNVYCHFHKDHGHSTENCKTLRDEIKELIRCGYLKKFIQREDKNQADRQTDWQGAKEETPPSLAANRVSSRHGSCPKKGRSAINMITSGSIIAGCTLVAGRASVRELENEEQNPPKQPRLEDPIYFMEDDACGIQYPHGDALVIKLRINDFEVKRILVDSGSSADILFKDAFDKPQLQMSNLKPTNTPLVGFSGKEVRPLGRVLVPVEVGTWPNIVRFEHTFLVVATPSPYNAIVGRPITHALRAVVSNYYLTIKFPMDYGVGVVRSDQLESRKCYVVALKGKAKLVANVEFKRPTEYAEERATSTEETVHIPVSTDDPAKTLQIGASIEELLRS